jgi:cell wall-associated NlpC family hydrolase
VTEQFRAGRDIDPTAMEPGDLVFFTTVSSGASHVGISIGGDEFVHAPSGYGEVRVERLSAPYWSTRFVGVKRVL